MEPVNENGSIDEMEKFRQFLKTGIMMYAVTNSIKTSEAITVIMGILFDLIKNGGSATPDEKDVISMLSKYYITYPSNKERTAPLQEM